MITTAQQSNPHTKSVFSTSTIQYQSNILTDPLSNTTSFKKLSSNQVDFAEIIQNLKDLSYFDKTKLIKNVIAQLRGRIMISQSRCFGQSLFLDTVKCYFQDKKDLFKGLAISKSKRFKHPNHIALSKDSDSLYSNEKLLINDSFKAIQIKRTRTMMMSHKYSQNILFQ